MTATSSETSRQLRCEQCQTPAADDQRYCLNCGAHISEARDPVAVYFSEASAARTRVAGAVARRAVVAQTRRLPRVSSAITVVAVVIALLIGIGIGHSSRSSSSGTTTTPAVTTTAKSKSSSKGTDVSKKTGKNYRKQESSLPTTVTP